MKKYWLSLVLFLSFSSQWSFGVFDRVDLGALKIDVRLVKADDFCEKCEFPDKAFYKEFARAPGEYWAIVWSDEVIQKKVNELKRGGFLTEEDKIAGTLTNKSSISGLRSLYFLLVDKVTAQTLRSTLWNRDRMGSWDYITPKGNYHLSLVQIGFQKYSFVLEGVSEAVYEWDD